MGGQFRENWKRLARKLPASNTSRDNDDLIRFKDQPHLTTNATGIAGYPTSSLTPWEFLYFDGTNVTSSGVPPSPPFIFFRAEAGIAHTANPAAFTTTGNGTGALVFDDTTEETIVFLGATSSAWDANSDITVKIFWMSNNAVTGNVGWKVSFERQNTNLLSDSFATAQSGVFAVGAASGVVTTSEITFTQAQADGLDASESFRLRLQRGPGVPINMLGDAFVVLVTVGQ